MSPKRSDNEVITHKPPCDAFIKHRETVIKQIGELQLCSAKLTSIEDNQQQTLKSHAEFRDSFGDFKTALALHQQQAEQILSSINEMSASLNGVERRTLTEEKVKNMLLEYAADFATTDDVDKAIDAGFNARVIKSWPMLINMVITGIAAIAAIAALMQQVPATP